MWASAPTKPSGINGLIKHRTLRKRPLMRHGRAMRAPTAKMGRMRNKLSCAASTPRSRAVRAALEKSPVAVTIVRFDCPARSREGVGSMGRDSSVERNSLGDASPWDARHGAQGSPEAGPPARFGNPHRAEKSPAGGKQAWRACVLPSNRPATGGFGPMWASAPTPRGNRFPRRGAHRASAWWRCLIASAERKSKPPPTPAGRQGRLSFPLPQLQRRLDLPEAAARLPGDAGQVLVLPLGAHDAVAL